MTKVIHLLLFITLCCCLLGSASSALADDDPKPGKAEAAQVIAYVKFNSLPTGLAKNHLLDDYVIALARAHQFDEAFKALTTYRSNQLGSEPVEAYLEEMHSAYRLTEMAEQMEQLKNIFSSYFEYDKGEMDRYHEETAVMQAIVDKNIPQATDLLIQTSKRDYWYLIKATQAKLGKLATEELIKSILAKAPEAKRPDFEETLIRWTKPGSPRIDYWLESLKATEKKVQRLQELENASQKEWLDEVRYLHTVPLELQEVAINKFLKAIEEEKENLTQEEISEYQRATSTALIKNKRFDALHDILKNHHPIYGSSRFYQKILSAVAANKPTDLKTFVDNTPDASKESLYDLSLIDFFSRHGFVDKAEKNIELLNSNEGTDWEHIFARARVDFYRALYETKIDDVNNLNLAYDKILKKIASDKETEGFTSIDVLGDQHLAFVAKRLGPEVALQLARAIPIKMQTAYHMQTDNAFGVCLLSLLSANEIDLAIEAGKLSTPTEREESRLAIGFEKIRKRIKPATWDALEKFLPNDPDVLRGAVQAAIDKQHERRALALARRQMIKHRSSSNGIVFAKAGIDWAEKVLAVAKEVQDSKPGDIYYKNHQESIASAMMKHLKFKDAEEAIEFANKYIKSQKYKHFHLLELAQRWARGR